MSEEIIQNLIKGAIDVSKFRQWLTLEQDDSYFNYGECHCSRPDFVLNFIAYIKNQTDSLLKVIPDGNQSENSSKIDQNDLSMTGIQPLETKESEITAEHSISTPKPHKSLDTSSTSQIHSQSFESRFETPVKRHNLSEPDRRKGNLYSPITPSTTSTDGMKFSTPKNSASVRRCNFDTPIYENRTKYNRFNRTPSAEKSTLNLGDFIIAGSNQDKSTSKKKRSSFKTLETNASYGSDKLTRPQNSSNEEFNVSDHDAFPCIGNIPSKSNEKRRINPTKISTSVTTPINSFRNVRILQENDAFKHQKLHQPKENSSGFEEERSILKKERHKLMEKFNILNSNTDTFKMKSRAHSLKSQLPNKPSNSLYIEPQLSQIFLKDELDILCEIYSIILDRNLVLNTYYELYYLLSLVVVKQSSDDYKKFELLLPMDDCILRSVHNCVYFAVETLSRQKLVLTAFLDKSCLRIISRNKRLMEYSPEFAEYLVNLYNSKVELDAMRERIKSTKLIIPESKFSDRNVCFESETDGVENFASEQNFRNFRKQRDVFYEIFRLWESKHNNDNYSLTILMQRQIRALLMMDMSPTNLAHLARLFTKQIISSCIHQDKIKTSQEEMALLQSEIGSSLTPDKLSKLAKRLEGTYKDVGLIKNGFCGNQEFFRDFIIYADSHSFRDHLRDSLASHLLEQDGNICISYYENNDRDGHFDDAMRREFVQSIKILQILAKFLGFLISIPYVDPTDLLYPGNSTSLLKHGTKKTIAPKDAVLSNEISVREQIQPPIDLLICLKNAHKEGRLSLTIPWIVEFMSMLDYAAFRLPAYRKIIYFLFYIHHHMRFSSMICNMCAENVIRGQQRVAHCSSCNCEHENRYLTMPYGEKLFFIAYRSAVIIKMCLGVLFDVPNFPQDMFYSWRVSSVNLNNVLSSNFAVNLDSGDRFSDDKLVNVNLDTFSRMDAVAIMDESASKELCPFIRDMSVLLNSCQSNGNHQQSTYRHITPVTVQTEELVKSKERELQMRLLEQFLRSQPSSTRRTLDFVSERVSSVVIKKLVSSHIAHSKNKANAAMAACVLEMKKSINADVDLPLKLLQVANEMTKTTIDKCKRVAALMIRRKCTTALRALLPVNVNRNHDKTASSETNSFQSRSDIYLYRVAAKYATRRVDNWLHEHCKPAIYCKDVEKHAKHLSSMKSVALHVLANELHLSPDGSSDEDVTAEDENNADLCMKNDGLVVGEADFNQVNISPTAVLVQFNDVLWLCLQNGGEQTLDLVQCSLVSCLQLASQCINEANLFIEPLTKKVIGRLSVDLSIFIVCFQPSLLTETILELFKAIWDQSCPKKLEKSDDDVDDAIMNKFSLEDLHVDSTSDEIQAYVISDDEDGNAKAMPAEQTVTENKNQILQLEDGRARSLPETARSESKLSKVPDLVSHDVSLEPLETDDYSDEACSYFDTILCPRNVHLTLQSGISNLNAIWDAMGILLLFLLRLRFIDEDSLTEQCLAIYRQDWPQVILENLARCMRNISVLQKPARSRGGKFTMFLEFLAEFCDDMELPLL